MMEVTIKSKYNVGDKVVLRCNSERWKCVVKNITFNANTREFNYDVDLLVKNKFYSVINNVSENSLEISIDKKCRK